MSKIFVNPSAIRAGMADLEMAEETVDLINRNIEDNQAHLQGEPIEVDSLPEEIGKLNINEAKPQSFENNPIDIDGRMNEDFQMKEVEDPSIQFQSYLDNIGIQIVRKMKTGERFFKIWSQTVEEIISYVGANFPNPSGKTTESKSTQTTPKKVKPEPPSAPTEKPEQLSRTSMAPETTSGPLALDWSATNDDDDVSVEAEIAHQIAESFSKKYKFPSRSSGIFLYNFEQLKMNLDDIVKEARGVPGIIRLAKEGLRLPLRCILGWVASSHSKKFQLLVGSEKLSKIMQDDLNRYMSC
ncbi:phosphoprotein [Lyssavirus australis]|uniref:Phosphoprotein n=3 Tax=Australian bat lyssavirus (isolate Bat/AUS/1996) TaxID=446561 RepID=PHOSP_ABLVB|nr:phosphoprotein [Lyssavirus australis]Q9QSP3.1 RecName: Full=Phosphoprotein; Short=Protein P; AltName: Full=Protein M1 [Australian bat lyssavirus bat/AUS/1996]AAD47897.1 phosphoprotein [Lyssavirus australis]